LLFSPLSFLLRCVVASVPHTQQLSFGLLESSSLTYRSARLAMLHLLRYLVDVAIHNAFILYQQKHSKQHYDEKAFRKELMQLLVGTFAARSKAAAASKRPRDALHSLQHGPERGPCAQCRSRVGAGHHNRRSHYLCVDCNIFLCMPDCYNRHIQVLAQQSIEHVDD
jgi:hypothetical protein